MDQTASIERFIVDLESGGTTNEEYGSKDTLLGVKQMKRLPGKVWSGLVSFDGSIKDEDGMNLCNKVPISSEVSMENVELLKDTKLKGEEKMALVEKETVKEKRKKTSTKKAPKPPRPPRGPSLDAVDQKLIREISELAMLKRARIERMKAVKKMKAAKATSSNGNIFALIITILFGLVILFQGIHCRSSSSLSSQVSPQSSVTARVGLITVQYYKNHSTNDTIGSRSPNFVKQVSESNPQEEMSRVAG